MKTQLPSKKQMLRIHSAVFAPNLSEEVSQLLKNTQIIDQLNSDQWEIIFRNYHIQKWNLIFPFMISASCSELKLYANNQEKIIMSISKTNFMELKQLSLRQNKITSIEQLQFINMPLLDKIYLSQNNIVKTSALNKCKWGQLNQLDLSSNRINQLKIQRLQMSNQVCEDKKYWGDQNRGYNWIVVLAKMNFDVIKLYNGNKGIKSRQRILESMKQKKLRIHSVVLS